LAIGRINVGDFAGKLENDNYAPTGVALVDPFKS
jgi:hypothetical protein